MIEVNATQFRAQVGLKAVDDGSQLAPMHARAVDAYKASKKLDRMLMLSGYRTALNDLAYLIGKTVRAVASARAALPSLSRDA